VRERTEDLPQHRIGKADDRVERRSQLVADVGEKLRLAPARDFGLLLGGVELELRLFSGGDVGVEGHEAAVGHLAPANLEDPAVVGHAFGRLRLPNVEQRNAPRDLGLDIHRAEIAAPGLEAQDLLDTRAVAEIARQAQQVQEPLVPS